MGEIDRLVSRLNEHKAEIEAEQRMSEYLDTIALHVANLLSRTPPQTARARQFVEGRLRDLKLVKGAEFDLGAVRAEIQAKYGPLLAGEV